MIRVYRDTEGFLKFFSLRDRSFRGVMEEARVIVSDIESRGEPALLKYVLKFDGFRAGKASDLLVGKPEIDRAYDRAGAGFARSIRRAVKNVERFHRAQMKTRRGFVLKNKGLETGERVLPVERAGIYVPGGRAAYPSSAVMNAVPARIAGVKEIIASTPPGPGGEMNPFTLAALDIAGVSGIYKMGGAHAIAAMAFGAAAPRVCRITGPGNAYVAAAKMLIQQKTGVGIDSVAGPTEVVIIADGNADAVFVAADLISQAEHGGDSLAILITASAAFAGKARREVLRRAEASPRKKLIEECLRGSAAFVIVKSLEKAAELSDFIAPEHLELHVDDPYRLMEMVRNAGAVFLGGYSPGAAGDYFAGPNHILPTAGRAVYASPLGVDDFLKRMNFMRSDRLWLNKHAPDIIRLAEAEGLYAHAEAVRLRMIQKKGS